MTDIVQPPHVPHVPPQVPPHVPYAPPMIDIKQLTKRYGDFTALSSIDLSVAKGEFVTLLGPSGSGKSTLLNMIAGMARPSSGSISLDGRDAMSLRTNQRELGMVFQNYALMPHMTVFENVAFPLRVRKVPRVEIRQRVERVLEMVSLTGTAHRKPVELSGGQQQRVSLARCIVYNPRLILMDEPLGALDKQLREQMQLEIKRLHSQLGITMLYVTHDQDEALTMSDRIVLMKDGRIEQQGRPDTLYFEPRTQFVASFIGHSNLLAGKVAARQGIDTEVSLQTAHGMFTARYHGQSPAEGAAASILVRPENLAILGDAQPPQGWNALSATAEDSIVLGGVVRHFLRLSDESMLIVQELNRPGQSRPRRGEALRVGWKVDDSRLLDA
jgi:putative spermidine/putrescine transport system ATP-binding protein